MLAVKQVDFVYTDGEDDFLMPARAWYDPATQVMISSTPNLVGYRIYRGDLAERKFLDLLKDLKNTTSQNVDLPQAALDWAASDARFTDLASPPSKSIDDMLRVCTNRFS